MNLSVRNRIYLTLGLFLTVAAVLSYFLIYPAIIMILETSTKMEETQVAIEKKYLSGQYLRRATQDIERIKESVEKLSTIFILTGEEYLFLPQFEEQMIALGHEIISPDLWESDSDNKKAVDQILNLSFSIQGNFPALIKSLSDLRQISQYINVDRVEFQALQNGLLQMSVTARVYQIDPKKISIIFDKENELN